MGTLVLRITPSSTSPLLGGNLGTVVSNDKIATLKGIQSLLDKLSAGAPSVATSPNTTALRCDVNPVAPSGTVTISSGSGTITAIINGVSIAITWATSDTNSAALLAAAINASTNALVTGLVSATSALGVVTITGIGSAASKAGNAITLSATGTGATASVSRLAGGTDGTAQVTATPASGAFVMDSASGQLIATIAGTSVTITASGGDTATGVLLANAIANNETLRNLVTVSADSGTVTVTARIPGAGDGPGQGNQIAIAASGSGSGMSASGDTLTGGLDAVSTRFTY